MAGMVGRLGFDEASLAAFIVQPKTAGLQLGQVVGSTRGGSGRSALIADGRPALDDNRGLCHVRLLSAFVRKRTGIRAKPTIGGRAMAVRRILGRDEAAWADEFSRRA
ncbi:hypothetical protein GGTG_08769 [Gaeumannomyces tritici R3-111a-1]|uniref:Uncharacterized protein n=1 Tax=Gaeumannomyces tritici (strain R3-111a-1) TaxID=644352 RepID=J3P5I0_GAET3|nr:hypothetical protein GGTG_08769 [Gaeumannomyces tritici R3-111a-1]EJT74931.1 hypothetical protein GGTG_08769 [Gaeumannomyces tritici R3-111a-1]